MTGFARSSGAHADFSWLWEIKSVNGRGLEIRCRMPGGFDRIEEIARKQIKDRFQRGSVNVHLQLSQTSDKGNYRINHAFLEELQQIAAGLVEKGVSQPSADGLLALKGVIEAGDQTMDEEAREALEAALAASLKEAIDKLAETREAEGLQLLPVLQAQLTEIEELVTSASRLAVERPEKARERLTKQIDLVLAQADGVEEGRLEQELAVLATKADVSEELDRLNGHVETVKDLFAEEKDAALGRRLDFICQEFNREANTLCSKAGDRDLTKIGLDLKVVIDRLREQVQNIE